ncbi:MAG: hypothetical protein EP346_13325 [Bacteroidetes bacterium]|nr:MAG: hypothetical protein EP346_13325 [Bacteroidota bacterium]
MKKLMTIAIILTSLTAYSEYNDFYTKVDIVTQDEQGTLSEYQVYHYGFDRPNSSFSLQKWIELFAYNRESDSVAIFFYNLVVYSPKMISSGYSFGDYYALSDTVRIQINQIITVNLIESYQGSTLEGIFSTLSPDDAEWMTSAVIDTAFFTVPLNMCGREDCIDILYPTFYLLIHEHSERTEEVIATLRSMAALHAKRENQLKNWYEYKSKSSPEYIEFINAYYPMVEAFLRMLDTEKVVILYDSGW